MQKSSANTLPAIPSQSAPVTDDSLWQKIRRVATRAGREVVEKALWLHYAAQRPETPAWARDV